ncbi:MAG: amidophosphoribosyltransferase [Planctomycetes bacterium]|nr:amidophosphoribosyltransferase [Planctomycetota bacterium]
MSGLFGVVSRQNCTKTLFYGTDYHAHLGTEVAGLAVLGDFFRHRIHSIADTQFKSRFAEDMGDMSGNAGIGVISDSNTQPFLVSSRVGDFAIVTSGLVNNKDNLAAEMRSEGQSFSEVARGRINPTELVAKMIASGKSIPDGIRKVFARIEGSVTMLLLTREGIYAARDAHGRSPLVVGSADGAMAVASESCAFTNLGFEVTGYLAPGEVARLTPGEVETVVEGRDECRICAFLWIYTGYPASSYEGISVEAARERCGGRLAERDTVEADLVAGVPDSGTAHAIGYAMHSGLPFRRPLVKYTPGYGRSYTPPSQDVRDLVAKMKLIPVRDVIKGQRIVLCEDSIVRGTQLKNLTMKKLWDNGAAEVHVRPACPPLMFHCPYVLSTRSEEELAARRAIRALEGKDIEDVSAYTEAGSREYAEMVEWIRRDLGATTLAYLELGDMIKAIGLPPEKLCTYCWTGRTSQP